MSLYYSRKLISRLNRDPAIQRQFDEDYEGVPAEYELTEVMPPATARHCNARMRVSLFVTGTAGAASPLSIALLRDDLVADGVGSAAKKRNTLSPVIENIDLIYAIAFRAPQLARLRGQLIARSRRTQEINRCGGRHSRDIV